MKTILNSLKMFLLFAAFQSCSFSGNYLEKPGYKLDIERNNKQPNAVIVLGTIIDFETKNPVKIGDIKYNDNVVKADILGNFKFETAPGIIKFTAVAVTHEIVSKKRIIAKRGDRIKIDFILHPASKPFID